MQIAEDEQFDNVISENGDALTSGPDDPGLEAMIGDNDDGYTGETGAASRQVGFDNGVMIGIGLILLHYVMN